MGNYISLDSPEKQTYEVSACVCVCTENKSRQLKEVTLHTTVEAGTPELQGGLSGWKFREELMLQADYRQNLLFFGNVSLFSLKPLTDCPSTLWRVIYFIQRLLTEMLISSKKYPCSNIKMSVWPSIQPATMADPSWHTELTTAQPCTIKKDLP